MDGSRMISNPWSVSPELLPEEFSVHSERGLSDEEVNRRLARFGANSLALRERPGQWRIFIKQLKSPMVAVLLCAGAIAFIVGERLDGWAILAIVFMNTLIGYAQEAKAEASLEALAALAAPKAKVLRGGSVKVIQSEGVVPGDVLILEAGDYVPADARIFSSHQLSAQEAVLTGESLPVEKDSTALPSETPLAERKNMLFAGTALSTGTASAIVTATGTSTEIGKIAEMMTKTETPSTPLQVRLEAVGRRLLWIGLGVVFLVVLLGVLQEKSWDEVIMAALSLSIAAVPEGLPTVVTIALVMAVRRMAGKKALVRKMDSVETLGATDVICTDKTGTLTTGTMVVRETFLFHETDRKLFFLNLVLCNNASGKIGDSTELALLEHVRAEGGDEEKIRQEHRRLYEWSFDSDRKRMSVAVESGGSVFLFTKGAPEAVLTRCGLSDHEREKVLEKVSAYSRKGMRVLGLSWRELEDTQTDEVEADRVETGLQFLGLIAMADPPRPESREAIKKCQSAGVRVIMITGDHPETAAAIACELGIIRDPTAPVLTGKEIDRLSDENFREESLSVSVYARVSPEHKLRLVTALKELGHVVAMTGDGVNDAPALKSASIGVAMGKAGTEVARQASSMVLTDDNFATIVDAVEEGRAVNDNIRRTLQYLLSTNLAELLFILIATAIGWPVPLLPVNLLWLNLVSDGLPSLALAAEIVPPEYLRQNPRPTERSFFNREFYVEMCIVSLIITALGIGVFWYGLRNSSVDVARGLAFSFLVYAVLLRSFSCRSETRTFFEMRPNIYHLLSISVPIAIQLVIQAVPALRAIFKVSALSIELNAAIFFLACVPVTIVELRKLRRRRSFTGEKI